MRALFFLALLSLVACGRDEGMTVNPALSRSVDRYFKTAPRGGRIDRLKSIDVGETPAGDAARCESDQNGKGIIKYTITVRAGLLEIAAPDYVDALVAHEMEHCLYARGHDPDEDRLMYLSVRNNAAYWAENLEAEIARLH